MPIIQLGKRIRGYRLEKALLGAAEKLRYKAEVRDIKKTEFRLNPAREVSVYEESIMTLTDNEGKNHQIRFNRESDNRDFVITQSEDIPLAYLNALYFKINPE